MNHIPAFARYLTVSLLLSPVLACGASSPADDTTDETAAAVTVDTKTACPRTLPENGSPCPTIDLRCSYGHEPRVACRQQAWCIDTGWAITDQTASAECSVAAPHCPHEAPTAHAACDDAYAGLSCVYGETAYTCDRCNGGICGTANQWFVTSMQSGCPKREPNLGASCNQEGLLCDYNICANTPEPDMMMYSWSLECQKGAWIHHAAHVCFQ